MDTGFRAVCEGAADQWQLPALAVGMSLGGAEDVVALGCDPGTRFRIASITKPLTATLALSLLGPDEAVRVWPDDVRVRHLLSHTSGFDCELPDRDQVRFGEGDDALARCVAELPGVRRWVGAEEIWSYANTGYWLAGALAAERAGETYEEALAHRVLEPAGLADTSFAPPDLEGTGPSALPEPYPRARRPSGGLTSTVADLLRFGRHHLADPGSARLRAAYGRPLGGVYGLGLAGERVGGLEVWGHGGSWGGFESSFLVVPERQAVFAGLTNASNGSKALRQIEDVFLRAATGSARPAPGYRTLPAETYRALVGTYANADGAYEVDWPEGSDGLVVGFEDEEAIGLALDDRTFQVPVGAHAGELFDFPRPGLARFGSRLAERTS